MHYLLNLFILLLIQLLLICGHIRAEVQVCDDLNIKSHGIDLSPLQFTTWSLTNAKERVDYTISVCSPLNSNADKECSNSYVCKKNHTDSQVIGYSPKSVELEYSGSDIQSVVVLYEGPPCVHYPKLLNTTIKMRLICGPHLEYPQHYMDTKCSTELLWKTYAVCNKSTNQREETKCYVYDNEGQRRDLTPLIKPKGDPYKVLSEDGNQFYINVCSGVSGHCTEPGTGACLKTGEKYTKVGDFGFNTMEYKTRSGDFAHNHIEMTYRTKSKSACSRVDANYTSVTTIRFICPPNRKRRSTEFLDTNPRLVSNLDCDYQIEWFTEYACPQNSLNASPVECELSEEVHGIDFNLKALLKSSDFYTIQNLTINGTKGYGIDLNICGGLGQNYKCGGKEWSSASVCLKSYDNPSKDRVIGMTSSKIGSTLKSVDNRLLLEYQTNTKNCSFDGIPTSEKTVIEFVCDDSKGMEYMGKPEFVSYEGCTYYIIWKTSVVCPVITANTPCFASHQNLTFDLSLLRKGYGSDSWTATVSQTLPWSRLAKDKDDTIFINVCGVVPKMGKTKSCDVKSSACMTIGGTDTSISLGQFTSPPKYNEDIKAIELIYENGFDQRTKKKLKTKITLRCKPGSFNSQPILVDVDEEAGIYELEWDSWAACPINSIVGTDCKVYDSFLGHTFDLNPLRGITPYHIITDGYDFYINVCGELKTEHCSDQNINTATGPFGICQVEKEGAKRAFSLGKANTNITYWNGVINMTYTEGTPYNNPEKTQRKSHIAFICDPNAGAGHPEYDGERDRSYFFRWYTSQACPHTPKTVHCVWENGTHTLDLSPLSMTTGNHFSIGLATKTNNVPSIYYINVCRPLSPIHNKQMSLDNCGADSAACRIILDGKQTALSLGKAVAPPFSGFDGSINLIYKDGSPCPANNKINISSRIKFECDPNSDLSNPAVYGPGSDLADNEECVYVFVWKTSAVCDIYKPTVVETTSCVFTDSITKLSADLSPLKRDTPYRIDVLNGASYELYICGAPNTLSTYKCSNSAICYQSSGSQSSQNMISYGLSNSSKFFFDGTDLRLRYQNGSKCMAHNRTEMMSSEIIFKCNSEAKHSEPKLHSIHSCVAVFEWETDLVCNLKPQKCSIVSDNQFYNLRQLSSLSHAWNTTDSDGNVYYLNVCRQLPTDIKCNGVTAASCKCSLDSNKKLICSESLGEPSADELQVIANGTLQLTYKNGHECSPGVNAKTQIIFKCGLSVGNPKFVAFDKNQCIYTFKWDTMLACSVTQTQDVLLPEQNGFLHDSRLDMYINVGPLISNNFTAKELRLNKENKTDEYDYVINLSSPSLSATSECSKAAVCQTKAHNGFKRDIGTIETIKYYLRGNELQIVLESTTKKCGRNLNKNVTTIFRLMCSSRSGVGEPVFMYESDDCDYTFNWDTDKVCSFNFMSKPEFETIVKELETTPKPEPSVPDTTNSKSGGTKVWIGIVIVVFFIITLTILFTYKQRVRQSLLFRFRRLFGPETTNHTFHYHQLASNEKDRQREEVVFISRNDAQNRNTIAAQPSGPVPYYSIYDDSDVDLLT